MVRKQRRSRPRRKQTDKMMNTTMDIVKVGVGATVGVSVLGAVAGALK